MPDRVIQVAGGELADEELAALMMVLLHGAPAEPVTVTRRPAHWHRRERPRGYRNPLSWR